MRCKSCMTPLNSQDSPLDFVASKKRLCPFCYTSYAQAQLMHRHISQVRRCEHLWTEWEFTEVSEDHANDDIEPYIFVRQCELCNTFMSVHGSQPPPESEELDISWCDLDRTTPEP